MPSVQRVEREIRLFEGFDVVIRHGRDRRDVRGDRGRVPGYAGKYERRARDRFTVADWKRARFQKHYPGFDVDVLDADGRPASGRARLGKLRERYR